LSISESIAIARDIAVLVLLVVTTFAVLIVYSKASKLLDSAKRTAKDVEDVLSTVSSKVVGTAAAGSGMAFGAWKLVDFLLGVTGRKGGDDG